MHSLGLKRSSTLFIVCVVVAAVVVSGVVLTLYVTQRLSVGGLASASINNSSTAFPPYTNLPAGCVKPANGFLIIANQHGYNDSIEHGAPQKTWPIMTVKRGATVSITVCNADVQAHGFQIAHYYDSNIQTVTPGQVIHVSFVADKPGDFEIYCSIFCSIHVYMQNGQLQVNS